MPFQVLAMNRFHTHRRIYAMVRNWPERGALILVDDKVDAIMTQHKNDLAAWDQLKTLRGPQAKASLNISRYAYSSHVYFISPSLTFSVAYLIPL